jgi:oxygen-independent coproporphyrinogen III oxidase
MNFAPTPATPPVLGHYNKPVPRYTSYPTAPHFHEHISTEMVDDWLASLPENEPVSIYIHLPFCAALCWYCGCNMQVTNHDAPKDEYMDVLLAEVASVAAKAGKKLKVSTIHLGGGTPTYMRPRHVEMLMDALRAAFEVLPTAEISIEIDPRQLTEAMADVLGKTGFNRASLGVQDTNPEVQVAINRVQPFSQTERATQLLRTAGITAINIDLIYGMPLQTAQTLRQTVHDVALLKPSRLAIYGYAHVPWMKKHMKLLEKHHIPDLHERLEHLQAVTEALVAQGYEAVGIDHFALPTDSMALAANNKTLHRNFMGYTTDVAETLLGFGSSSISAYPQGYVQNVGEIPTYSAAVRQGVRPLHRGLELKTSDKLTAEIIRSILCHFEADVPAIAARYGLPVADIFVDENAWQQLVADGAVSGNPRGVFTLTTLGRQLARPVAACFDAYLKPQQGQHSKL